MIKIVRHLLPLFVVQFFTWLGLFALWIYATPVITRYIFDTTDAGSEAFERGIRWVGIYFAFYATLAAMLAFFIPRLLKKMPAEKLHALCLVTGAAGLVSIGFIRDHYLLLVSFAFIGIAWSSISNIPYRMISDAAPGDRMTLYFTVFNFSVVTPQVIAAFLLAWLNKQFFAGETMYVIFFGACSMFLAGAIMLFVKIGAGDEPGKI